MTGGPDQFRAWWEVLGEWREVIDSPGLLADVEALVGQFTGDPMARIRMAVARRSGLPYGEVLRRWDLDDLAAEVAWDLVEASERLERCQQCGTHPDDVVDQDGRILEASRWKVYVDTCPMCAELARVNDRLRKDDEIASATTAMVRPRNPGDPFVDDGGIFDPDDDPDDDE